MVSQRLRAIWETEAPEVREYAGLHELDGQVQDLSPAGVAALLSSVGQGSPEPNAHDEAHLSAAEAGARAAFFVAETHRWNPLVHVANLDLSCYDRDYEPADQRAAAKTAHLRAWPGAIDGAIDSLDSVPAPVAAGVLPVVRGLGCGLRELVTDQLSIEIGRTSLGRLTAHLEQAAISGSPYGVLDSRRIASLLADPEAMSLELGRLEEVADAEAARIKERLALDCDRLRPGEPPADVVNQLRRDYPADDSIDATARSLIEELMAFTTEHGLLPDVGGTCLVGPAPPSRRRAATATSCNGAYESEAPSWFHLNPPDESWGDETNSRWRANFSTTLMPAITAHAVAPGRFALGRMVRLTARGDVRRSLASPAFVGGWAHYSGELLVEEGFRRDDPRFAIGVWLEALLRTTRLAAAIGVNSRSMTLGDAASRFSNDALLDGPAARAEATRALYEPTYGCEAWGKIEIMALRDEAIARWGQRFTFRRFHEALLELGAPPLGTLGDALEPGCGTY